MKALQYIYTSWRNGTSSEKGYMIYSKSVEISQEECEDIKFVMQYMAPKEMVPNPTQEEIIETFPYSFAYFKLSSGRACIAQSTYLGKDYSGRYGNYIIYALVIPMEELEAYPVELFAEEYIKTSMTEDELLADSPVSPLPALEIRDYGNVINDEQIMEFLYEREEEFSYFISAVLEAKHKDIPFYLNDTRENLVLWLAALQKMLPLSIAKSVTFSTYVGNHDKFRLDDCRSRGLNLTCFGVRPDANYFNYSLESNSNRQIVMDFLGGHMTEKIQVLSYARAMAASYTLGMDEITRFSSFLEDAGFSSFSKELEDAYTFYHLYSEDEFEHKLGNLIVMLRFGMNYCTDEMNLDIGMKLISRVQKDKLHLSIDELKVLIPYLYTYCGLMIYTVHDIIYEILFEYAANAQEDCHNLFELLSTVKNKKPDEFQGFLDYFNSEEIIEQSKLYLEGNTNPYSNLFYAKFIFMYYPLRNYLSDSRRVVLILKIIFNNILLLPNDCELIIQILKEVQEQPTLVAENIAAFVNKFDDRKMQIFGNAFGKWMDELPSDIVTEIENELLVNPKTSQFTLYLCSKYILQSLSPEKVFWDFYSNQRNYLYSNSNLDLSPMISAYLERENDYKTTVKILEKVEISHIRSVNTVRAMICSIEELPVKSIIKLENHIINKLLELARQYHCSNEASKMLAITFGNFIEKQFLTVASSRSFSQYIAEWEFNLTGFDKKDYDEYLYEYMSSFLKCIKNCEDVRELIQACYYLKYISVFSDNYISILKKMEKKEEKKWAKLVIFTCICIIDYELTDDAVESFAPHFIKYLKKYEPDELCNIQMEVLRESKNGNSSDFFDRIYEKEGLRDKLSGFFRKK